MPAVPVEGTDLYYVESGARERPSLLFIHGMCGFAEAWDDQIARLSPQFRCVAYDRRGHSRSPLGQSEERSVERHADDAAALIGALALAPCVVVSSSGGARVALDLVRRSPHLLKGAVLSEPPALALAPPEEAAVFVNTLRPLVGRGITEGGPRAAVDAFFDYVCPGLWERLDETRRDRYRDNHAELFGDLRMPPYAVTPDDLTRITVPCLIIRGAKTHAVFASITQVLADHIPGARLMTLEGSGHVTYAEQPVAFAEATRAFAVGLGV